ncbi:MAG TPA: glycosyltransferase family 4 protein [Candidatus Binataceae bacterium]|nr:glycosyltransferase family 4 protein [Candidatus Binataceae bacterium]
MAKILFLNRVFGSETEATGVLLSELAEDLAFDNEVTVVCARTGADRRIRPLIEVGHDGAIRVLRTFAPNVAKRRALLRYLDYIAYFVLAGWAALRERADIVVAETDPPILGALGAGLAFLRRRPFIYYCQDIYPEVGVATGAMKSRLMLLLVSLANRIAYRRADAVVVLADDMAGLLRRKGVSADKIVVVPNWIDCGKVRPQPPRADLRERYAGSFAVMYAGNLGWTQNLESVLDAAHRLRGTRVKFVLVGSGARKTHLEEAARARGLDNVEFIDRVEPSRMSEVLAAADLHLIPLGPGVAGTMVPSKVYGILAAGKPFVAMMERHAEVARIAAEAEVGFVVAPDDAVALAATIEQCLLDRALLEEMGRRARALAERAFDRSLMTRRFADLLEAVPAGRRGFVRLEEPAPAQSVELEKVATMPAE